MRTLTISTKGQIVIPKEARSQLSIHEGDKLGYEVVQGKIILFPVENVPRSQMWFFTDEVQSKVKKSEKNYSGGKYKKANPNEFIKALKDR
jgi:AbrB family looped-hinge helix DNA binding protein